MRGTARDNLFLSNQGGSRCYLAQWGETIPWVAFPARAWPNIGMQATANSVRSSLAPALRRA